MRVPTIHLNGTSKEELLKQYSEAVDALVVAIEKLNAAAPHERDYCPQGGDVFRQARNEHYLRVSKVTMVKEELEGIWSDIFELGQ